MTGNVPARMEELESVSSLIAVPLVVENRVFGLLAAFRTQSGEFFSDLGMTRLQTFSEFSSMSIDNFLKYGELLEKRKAQYQALSSQVQPHFIYNVLSGILRLNSRGDSEGIQKTVESLKGYAPLHPLVENSVIHGIEPLEEGGRLEVTAREIRWFGEKGAGFNVDELERKANIGLTNVRQIILIAFSRRQFQHTEPPG